MKALIIVLSLLGTFASFAQSLGELKGNITDKKGEPLSFVSIYLDKTVTGTTSNDNGEYVLNINKKGNYTIIFQFLGYKTLKN